jgi:hypothetical protein
MKYFLNFSLIILIAVYSFSCSSGDTKDETVHDGKHEKAVKPTSSTGNFGEIITADGSLPSSELPTLLDGKKDVSVKLTGDIQAVCQMSGCWMDVAMEDGEVIHVTFKDDAFVLPKDAAGKTTVIEGIGSYEEIPVSMLKHLAEDEGKTQEEIDAITEPKMEYTFTAHGVIIEEK